MTGPVTGLAAKAHPTAGRDSLTRFGFYLTALPNVQDSLLRAGRHTGQILGPTRNSPIRIVWHLPPGALPAVDRIDDFYGAGPASRSARVGLEADPTACLIITFATQLWPQLKPALS